MRHGCAILAAIGLCAATSTATAAEPNETFATATMLSAGTLVVSDTLTPGVGTGPDTLLGAVDDFGFIYEVDDDGSDVGDGRASGLTVLDVNTGGSIDFVVTGADDDNFFGDHGESGEFEVIVDVYDEFDDYIETVSEVRTLTPGFVEEFSFFDLFWSGGTYDVNIDNLLTPPVPGDIDFFTFTGLTPGAAFTAQTADPTSSDIDTVLGWFDATGALVAADDDGAGGLLSLLMGNVPANGRLTFAVTGFGDDEDFTGIHFEEGAYQLKLTTAPVLAADFDDNGSVNAADLAIWRGAYGVPGNVAGNADGDNDTDGADFLVWQRERGSGPLQGAAAVPEPCGLALAALALMCHGFARKR